MFKNRQMHLTPELLTVVARTVADPGPLPGTAILSDSDYVQFVQDILATKPTDDIWIFGYGSLIWNPACDFVEQRLGVAHGWHRSFCMEMKRFRGSPEEPGLMMALDRGGVCKGMAYRLAADTLEASLGKLFRREMTANPPPHRPRWLAIRTAEGPLRAISFVMDRSSSRYIGGLAPEKVAEVLTKAAGHWGSGAEYLYSTVQHLETLGIHDRQLWQLQKLVAEQIRTLSSGAARPK